MVGYPSDSLASCSNRRTVQPPPALAQGTYITADGRTTKNNYSPKPDSPKR